MRSRVVVVALVIVIIVILGFLFLAPLFFGAGFNADMQVTWLDENGNPVVGPSPYSFIGPLGIPVVSVKTDISFTLVSSSGAPVDAPQVSGTLTVTVKLNTYTGGIVNTETRPLLWTGRTTGSVSFDWNLADLIGTPTQSGKDNGWVIVFELVLDASAVVSGDTLTASDTASERYIVEWGTDTLLLTGVVNV